MEYREHFEVEATDEPLETQRAVDTASVFTLADVGITAICPDIYVVQPNDTYYGIASKLGITVYELSGLNPYVNPDALRVGQQLCIPLLAPDIEEPDTRQTMAMHFATPTVEVEPVAFDIPEPYTIPIASSQVEAVSPQADQTLPQMEAEEYIQSIATMPSLEQQFMPQQQPDIAAAQQQIPADCMRMVMPSGWNFYNILMRYGISYEALSKANPGVDIGTLTSGQMICIPPAGSRGLSQDSSLGTHIVERSDSLETIARRYRVSAAYLLQINPNLAPDDFTAGRVVCVPN